MPVVDLRRVGVGLQARSGTSGSAASRRSPRFIGRGATQPRAASRSSLAGRSAVSMVTILAEDLDAPCYPPAAVLRASVLGLSLAAVDRAARRWRRDCRRAATTGQPTTTRPIEPASRAPGSTFSDAQQAWTHRSAGRRRVRRTAVRRRAGPGSHREQHRLRVRRRHRRDPVADPPGRAGAGEHAAVRQYSTDRRHHRHADRRHRRRACCTPRRWSTRPATSCLRLACRRASCSSIARSTRLAWTRRRPVSAAPWPWSRVACTSRSAVASATAAITTARLSAASATDPNAPLLAYTTPARRAGMWAPGGVAIGNDGTLFAATGNGDATGPEGRTRGSRGAVADARRSRRLAADRLAGARQERHRRRLRSAGAAAGPGTGLPDRQERPGLFAEPGRAGRRRRRSRGGHRAGRAAAASSATTAYASPMLYVPCGSRVVALQIGCQPAHLHARLELVPTRPVSRPSARRSSPRARSGTSTCRGVCSRSTWPRAPRDSRR